MKTLLNRYSNGALTVFYILDTESEMVGLTLLPAEKEDLFTLEGEWQVENLIQLKLMGDAYPGGYAQGVTLRNSESCSMLKYVSQSSSRDGETLTVVTELAGPRVSGTHILTLPDHRPYARIRTVITNTSDEIQKLEMLSSFSLCDLSPAEGTERMKDLELLRLRSRWSGEGKLIRESLLSLHMEPSWIRIGVNDVRWGQVGSMPVRGFFPWGVLKDRRYDFVTGATLDCPGSWQMELYEKDDKVALSGGQADREFGHWTKELILGEVFMAPEAVIASCSGDADEIGHALTLAQEDTLSVPAFEEDLPFIFNEYCTTWGNPTEENVHQIINSLRDKGFRYLVIDAGWYSIGDGAWYDDQGDWDVNLKRFPGTLKSAADAIRDAGMIPGLWFEYECINHNAKAYRMEDLQLQRDGQPISDGGKRFWNMDDPDVWKYLDRKVLDTLRENGFGYIKVDYNGNIGTGADGEESEGEILRRSVEGSRAYFRHMREEMPDLVIENCASGGHRLAPAMMGVSSMASFSDAHECLSVPVIAAALHRTILPRQSQIWAVMRASDTERRIVYSLTAGMLGRLCLSGDVYDLNEKQWDLISGAMRFYRKCVPVIRHGFSRISGDVQEDWDHLKGTQILLRSGEGESENNLLAIVHRFSGRGPVRIPLPDAGYRFVDCFAEARVEAELTDRELILHHMGEFSGAAVLLKK